MNSLLERMTATRISILVTAFAGCVAPGLLAVFFYRPNWIVELDAVKLLLLSAVISAPVFAFNCLAIENMLDRLSQYWDETILMGGVLSTAVSLYGSLWVAYAYVHGHYLRSYFILVVVMEVVLLLLLGIGVMIARLSKGDKSKGVDIEEAIHDVVAGIPINYVFDSHFVIEELILKHYDSYARFIRRCNVRDGRLWQAHGHIGKMIAKSEGPNFIRVDKSHSRNVNGEGSGCTAWQRI